MSTQINLFRPTSHPRATSLRYVAVIMLGLYLTLLIYFSLKPSEPNGGGNSDKVLHFIVYGGLSALIAVAFPRVRLITVFVTASLIGAGLEIAQEVSGANRTASFLDQLANMAGALLVLSVWLVSANIFYLLRRKIKKRPVL